MRIFSHQLWALQWHPLGSWRRHPAFPQRFLILRHPLREELLFHPLPMWLQVPHMAWTNLNLKVSMLRRESFLGLIESLSINVVFDKRLKGSGYNPQCRSGVSKLWPDQIWPAICFCMACKQRMVFVFLNYWKGNKRRKIFCDIEKLYEVWISEYINKVVLEYSYTFSLI